MQRQMQWRQLGGGGAGGPSPPPPQDFQNDIFLKFYWFYWFNVQYVHTYQALVPFSTWIDFNIGGDDTGFLAWRRKKKFFLPHKKFCPQEICELALLGKWENPLRFNKNIVVSIIIENNESENILTALMLGEHWVEGVLLGLKLDKIVGSNL